MKLFCNALAFVVCLITLGFIDVTVKHSDKTQFKWVGWISRLEN